MSDKKILNAIYILSVVVLAAVIVLYNLPKADHVPSFVKHLPALNATLNGTCFILLLFSFYFIRKKQVAVHKKLNIAAFLLSCLFMVSYITFHSFGIETRYPEDGPLRPVYLIILLTHIVLAAVVLPLVLISFYRGLGGQVEKHRKIVRWSFPIWLYVTLSGVVVYLMISPYYKF